MAENGNITRPKTLFSKRVPGKGKTYFIDVRESDKNGSKYLVLTESRLTDGVWKRSNLLLFSERAADWKKTFEEALAYL